MGESERKREREQPMALSSVAHTHRLVLSRETKNDLLLIVRTCTSRFPPYSSERKWHFQSNIDRCSHQILKMMKQTANLRTDPSLKERENLHHCLWMHAFLFFFFDLQLSIVPHEEQFLLIAYKVVHTEGDLTFDIPASEERPSSLDLSR